MLERMWREGNPPALLVGMWTSAATLENCVEVPQRVKSRPALRPSNCTVGDLPQWFRCNEMPGHLHPDVYSRNVHNSQTVEGASVSIERWMDKEDVVYIYSRILLSQLEMTNTQHLLQCEWTGGYYTEWNKSIGEGQTLYCFIHSGNIKNSERD